MDLRPGGGLPPNQVFIGTWTLTNSQYGRLLEREPRPGRLSLGLVREIMPEEEFYGMMKICDEFEIMLFEKSFLTSVSSLLKEHPLIAARDLSRLGKGTALDEIEQKIREEHALPLYVQGDRLVGCLRRIQEDDPALYPDVLVENLAARASGVLSLRHLIAKTGKTPEDIDYLLGFGEEAVGDRYNRGGGNLAKAIGELCGCQKATGRMSRPSAVLPSMPSC